jgi:hypothetical protein
MQTKPMVFFRWWQHTTTTTGRRGAKAPFSSTLWFGCVANACAISWNGAAEETNSGPSVWGHEVDGKFPPTRYQILVFTKTSWRLHAGKRGFMRAWRRRRGLKAVGILAWVASEKIVCVAVKSGRRKSRSKSRRARTMVWQHQQHWRVLRC